MAESTPLVLSPQEAEAIRRLSEAVRRDGRWDWEREAASKTSGVPVYADMGGVLVVRSDGVVLLIESNRGVVEEVREERWILVARQEAALKYPELKGLMPVRPEGATDCQECAGHGSVNPFKKVEQDIRCGVCCGMGWLKVPTQRL